MATPALTARPAGRALGGDLALWLLHLATVVGVFAALVGALILTPREAVEGDVFRIFYIHVPLAWIAYLAFFVVFVASILYLWRRAAVWDRVARVSAEIGLLFTSLVLITGSIWGRPVWGVWWTWDARLTTTLVLWFMYLAYLLLRSYARESGQAPRYAAVLGIVAFVDVPIVQFSVTWWRTLHPQSDVLQAGHLAPSMLVTLMVSLLAFTLLALALFVQRYRIEALRDEARLLRERLEEMEV
jgi:heme exporter protein C